MTTPWKINGWNLKITHLERKMIFQTSMIMFHVNLPRCIYDLIPIHKLNQTLRHVKSAAGLDIGGWYCHWLLAAQEGFFLPGSGHVSCRPRECLRTVPCLHSRGGTRPRAHASAACRPGDAFPGPGGGGWSRPGRTCETGHSKHGEFGGTCTALEGTIGTNPTRSRHLADLKVENLKQE